MAQTAPIPPAEGAPRPLPRGGRITTKNTRPRFQSIDAVWMLVLAGLFVGLSTGVERQAGQHWTEITVGASSVLMTYLLGWRASGRVAGIIAALLLAGSATFASLSANDLHADLFALLTVASLFAFVAGSSLAAVGLAAFASGLGYEGILLGLVLLGLSLAQHRQRAALCAAVFVALTTAALIVGIQAHSLATFSLGANPHFFTPLGTPSFLFLLWFLLPFCGEFGDAVRRARWLPLILWTACLLLTGFSMPSEPVTPLLPLLVVMIGAGLARLMPILAGEFPSPALRYTLATLAVLSLVGLRGWQEWPLWRSFQAPPPAHILPQTIPTPPAPALPIPPPPITAPPATPHTVTPQPLLTKAQTAKPKVPKSHTVTAPHPKTAKPIKPAVPLYHMVNGRLVRRSPWAIQWEMTHPKH